MLGYVVRRIAWLAPTLFGVSLVTFFFVHWMPGDPAEILAGEHASPTLIAEIRHELRLDRPLPEQYVRYLGDVARGDLGRSAKTHEDVRDEIRRYFPATAELALAAMTIAIAIGVPAGLVAARRPGGWVDATATSIASVGVSMPVFWLGLLLMYAFAVHWPILPVSGRGFAASEIEPRTGLVVLDALLARDFSAAAASARHLVLPALVLGTVPMAVLARMTRSSVVEALGQDYVRTARSKGLRESTVLLRHAARNGILPTLTVAGLQFGALLGGAILTETIFAWP
ncbi:MAG: ABC transporter permease, partial [Gemmatimonadetes bacterium]|nr:ABC transporter permease [Gemmatimonadota bacterium]